MSIRNTEVELMAREIAGKLNISMTQAIIEALKEKKASLKRIDQNNSFFAETIKSISEECAALPDLDKRPPDEILGYDEKGGFPW